MCVCVCVQVIIQQTLLNLNTPVAWLTYHLIAGLVRNGSLLLAQMRTMTCKRAMASSEVGHQDYAMVGVSTM